MKLLLLNPNSDAERKIAAFLKKHGVALLSPASVDEAWQTLALHGSSVDLALIHREGLGSQGEPGIELIKKIKADPTQSDLPFILTTEKWSEAECAAHQTSPQGANGYLRLPIDENQLQAMIEAILGQSLAGQSSPSPSAPAPVAQASAPLKPAAPQASKPAAPSSSKAPPPPAPSAPVTMNELPDEIHLEPPANNGGVDDPSQMFSMADPGGDASISVQSMQLQSAMEHSNAFMTNTDVTGGPPPAEKQEGTMRIALSADGGDGLQIESRDNTSVPFELSTPPPTVPGPEMQPSAGSGIAMDQSVPSGISMSSVNIPRQEPSVSQSIMLPDAMSSAPPPPATPEQVVATPAPPPPVPDAPDDREAVRQMPYLFGRIEDVSPAQAAAALAAFAQPVGDAVVPGGAAQTPDLETLKKYLLLREQDVAALSAQLKASREQVASLEDQLKKEQGESALLTQQLEQHRAKLERFEQEKAQVVEGLQSEINELRFQIRAKGDKAASLEAQVKAAADEVEQIKKRVRLDIRKIRMREKELENKLEILKKDSEALIGARETKIIELKRKLDLLEFNMDLLQDQYGREKELTADLKLRLAKVAQAMKVAGGLLDVEGQLAPAAENATEETEKREAV